MAPTLTEQLGTITAIVALAFGLTQVLKMLLMKYKVGMVSDLPTPLLCIGVSMGLTLVAHFVLQTLPGQWYDLLWQAGLAAGAASGFFSWAANGMDSPASKLPPSKPLFLLLGLSLVLSSGCSGMSNGQKYIVACETYATTANTLAVLVRAGDFGVTDKTRIRLLNDTAKDILLKMREDLIAGKTFNQAYMLTQFQTVLDELLRMQLAAEAAKNRKETPTSGPNNAGLDRHDGSLADSLAAGQSDHGVRDSGQATDAGGARRGDPGSDAGARQPGQRPAWRSPCPAQPPGLTITIVDEVVWTPSKETEWD